MNVQKKLYDLRFVFLAFFLSASIMIITYAAIGILDFGIDGKSILRVDLYHQYAPFHEELRSKILNGKSLFYSWEGGMGKELISQIAYYTASPISFLILLFPQEALPDAMATFILIKIAFAGAFFAYYLKKSFEKNDLTIVAFAMLYAFSAFVTCYYWNLMWLDAVAVFPLVALGIEKIVKENKHSLYCLTLAFTIIVNFYIAFIVCIISVLYFLVVVFTTYELKKDKKIMINAGIKFAIASLIAGGISMFLTIPTAVALSNTQASDSTFPAFEIYENVLQLLTGHFFSSKPVILGRNEDLPNVYSGVITMILMPVYFFNKNIKKKEKILFASIVGFMLLCSCIKPLDYLIHGAHFPSNLPHRYTFMYSFLLITMAYKAFLNIRGFEFKYVYRTFALYTIVILVTEYLIPEIDPNFDRIMVDGGVIANIVIMAVYIIYLNYYNNTIKRKSKNSKIKEAIIFPLLVFMVIESCASSIIGLMKFGVSYRTEYNMYTDDGNEAVKYLKENDDEKFFRQEFKRFTFINEAAYYHYKGFSIFSSLAYGNTSQLMEDLGIAATSNSYRYYDPTPLIDSLFNIKYIMHKNQSYNKSHIGDDSPYRDNPMGETKYEHFKDFGKVSVYKNPYYLPLGFMVNSDIKDWETLDSTPFDVQNDFIAKASDNENKILNKINITSFTYKNIKLNDIDENEPMQNLDGVDVKYNLVYPKSLQAIPSVEAKIYVDKAQHVYAYVDAGNAKRFKYWIKNDVNAGADADRELSTGRSLIDFGDIEAGTMITVRFELTNKGEFEKTYRKSGNIMLYAASFDDEAYKEVYEQLNDDEKYELQECTDTYLKGSIMAKKDGVMYTSIPYDKGWSVKVDGKDAELLPIAGEGLIGVELTEGTHIVEFEYTPKGLYMGIVISVGSVAIFIIYSLITLKLRGKKEDGEQEAN